MENMKTPFIMLEPQILWHETDWKSSQYMNLICQMMESKVHAKDYLDWRRLEAKVENEEDIGEHLYDDYNEDEEEEIDLLPIQGESLVLQQVLSTPKVVLQEDWRKLEAETEHEEDIREPIHD